MHPSTWRESKETAEKSGAETAADDHAFPNPLAHPSFSVPQSPQTHQDNDLSRLPKATISEYANCAGLSLHVWDDLRLALLIESATFSPILHAAFSKIRSLL